MGALVTVKTERHLLHLHQQVDSTLPIEVMLHHIEEVHQFLTANPNGNEQACFNLVCIHQGRQNWPLHEGP